MEKITDLNSELKDKLLKFLYEDEMYNVHLINLLHNNKTKELYIFGNDEKISAVLHMNYDGNSYFTTFAYDNEEGLKEIISQLKEMLYPKILVAGKTEDVAKIVKSFNKEMTSYDAFYKFEGIKKEIESNLKVRLAAETDKDINTLREFFIDFFEAETEEEKREIGERNLLMADIRDGVYYLDYEDKTIGMTRICARTDNYGEITGVYIAPDFRGHNYASVIVSYVVNELLKEGRCAVLEAHSSNAPAIKTYEKLGFKKKGNYSFEFLT